MKGKAYANRKPENERPSGDFLRNAKLYDRRTC